jgi:hypothetical protein
MELGEATSSSGPRRSTVAVRAYRPLPPTEIDATSRRSRCHGATLEQYLAGSAGGPHGRGPVDASKANLV